MCGTVKADHQPNRRIINPDAESNSVPGLVGMKKILVVDDEIKILDLVCDYLKRAGYQVITAGDGLAALEKVKREKPDLIVLDLGLPKMDGLDVTREVRRFFTTPIIMLTARGDESDKLIGLELGADDYLTKPFSPKELVARVRVVFRRIETYQQQDQQVFRIQDLSFDLPRMRVSAEDRSLEELTPTEFDLLVALAKAPGRIFTRAQLLDEIHGVAFESYERAIDAHIKNIRRKIEPNPREPQYIHTVYGVGYRFADR